MVATDDSVETSPTDLKIHVLLYISVVNIATFIWFSRVYTTRFSCIHFIIYISYIHLIFFFFKDGCVTRTFVEAGYTRNPTYVRMKWFETPAVIPLRSGSQENFNMLLFVLRIHPKFPKKRTI